MNSKIEESIKNISTPCMILAGAGTGKTHTIVEKIKYLIKEKIYSPEKIVCITFSNEASNNILLRIKKSFLSEEKEPIIKTFHSFSADLLKKYAYKISLKEKFKILTPEEAKVILHRNLKIIPYYCHQYINSIGISKDFGISIDNLKNYIKKISENLPEDLKKYLENLKFELHTLYLKKDKTKKKELVERIKSASEIFELQRFVNTWSAYEKIKEKYNYLDYSDLNNKSYELISKNPEIAQEFDYFIVDEFQDTNKIQIDFLKKLCTNNITVVGDMNQSIYRFRGAYKKNFEDFIEHFNIKKENTFILENSFRCPDKILKISNKLIEKNHEKKEDIFSIKNYYKKEGNRIKVFELKNAKEEARKIVEIIKEQINSGTSPEEICVLFRAHQQGRIIKKHLENNNISYSSITKNSLLQKPEIKIVIDYLTILNKLRKKSKGGEQAWWDLIYQAGFIEEDIILIGKFLKENKDSENISEKIISSIKEINLSEKGKISAEILIEKIKKIMPILSKDLKEIIEEIYKISGIIPEGDTTREKIILADLKKFLELAEQQSELYYEDVESFLHYIDSLNNLGIEIESSKIEDKGVKLMTLHATKGLEFKTVIISNLSQGRFPIEKAQKNNLIPSKLYPESINKNISEIKEYETINNLSEERRLCYVAFTRAKENLILTYAKEYSNKYFSPSQFLLEIDYQNNLDIIFDIDLEEKYKENEILTNKKTIPQNIIPDEIHFSPSALLLFKECKKKYEYKYVYNMPEKKTISWEAIQLGSFVHLVLEKGVKENFKEIEKYLEYAKELHLKEEWNSVDFETGKNLITIFFERNKNKYNEKSLTEQMLKTEIEGIKFIGFADRIDFNEDGLEIIDYKTGKTYVPLQQRNWQLGYYAISSNKFGKVRKITLEMLQQEKPLEFEIDSLGNAKATNSYYLSGFNIHEIKKELVETAKEILSCYKEGFSPCPIEKNCEFCNEYIYVKN